MTIDHCWHDTGRVAESLPPRYEQRCCSCGRTRWTRRDGLNPESEESAHGQFQPTCAPEPSEGQAAGDPGS
jgi:hypothetical protein